MDCCAKLFELIEWLIGKTTTIPNVAVLTLGPGYHVISSSWGRCWMDVTGLMRPFYTIHPSASCLHCKQDLPLARHWRTKFCSMSCGNAHRLAIKLATFPIQIKELTCPHCEKKIIKPPATRRIFCSASCQIADTRIRQADQRREARDLMTCIQCKGKIVGAQRNDALYCSKACQNQRGRARRQSQSRT